MQHALRSRARPLSAVVALSLFISIVIIPPALACTPPDELFNLTDSGSYLIDGVQPVASARVGTYVFSAARPGLAVLDVAIATDPSVVATAAAGDATGVDIDVEGAIAWLAASDGRVYAYNVADPSAPVALGNYLVGDGPLSVDASGDRLYVGAANGVRILDVSDPAAVSQVGFYATPEPTTDVLVVGDVLYAGYSHYSVLATYETYGTTVISLDISSDTPSLLDSHGVPEGRVKLAVSGDSTNLFTAISYPGGSSYLKVFDISDPGVLHYIAMFSTGYKGAVDIAVSGDMVLLAGLEDTRLYDMTDPVVGYMVGFSPDGSRSVIWPDDTGTLFYALNASDGWLDVYAVVPVSERSLGPNRYDTAVDLNDEFKTSEYVVLATGANFPDALAAAPLAYALGAPVLLVESCDIPDKVADKIQALGATKAYILGSQGAISDTVRTQLIGLGMADGDIKRLGGESRYETAALIALELKVVKGGAPLTTAFIATGEKFPDALAASAIAAKMGAPVLLVHQDYIPAVTAAAITQLGVTETIILGGENAISDSVVAQLPSPTRLEGADRYATAKAIADWAMDESGEGFAATELFIVTGRNFPDAMPCGVVAATHSSVMLLVNEDVPWSTEAYVNSRKASITGLRIVGGTNAVSTDVERVLVGMLK